MKRISTIIAVICLLAVSFTLFVACSGNVKNVDKYMEKLNKEKDFIFVSESTSASAQQQVVQEVLISGKRMQVSQYVYSYKNGKVGKEIEKLREEDYYEVLSKDKVRHFFTFDCTTHKKDGKPVKEWKFEDVEMPTNIIDAKRTELRETAKLFDLKSANLVWDKAKKGFVYKSKDVIPDTITSMGVSNVVVTAKSGALTINMKTGDTTGYFSYMNFGTARVAFPALCETYAKKLKK